MKSVSQCVIVFAMAALSCSAQLTITTMSLPDAIVGQPYPISSLQTSGAIGAVTWSVVLGALPSGFVVGPAQTGQPAGNGTLCLGTPDPVPNAPPDCDTTTGVSSVPNPYNITILAVDAQNQGASKVFMLNVDLGLTLTSASSWIGIVGTPFSQTLTASGGQAPFTWSILSASLPTGLTLDPLSGQVTGTPTVSFSPYTITFKRTDSLGQVGVARITISIFLKLVVVPTEPDRNPPGVVGGLYDSIVVDTEDPGGGPFAFTIVSGALPPGLILNPVSGHAQGTPTASGTFSFTVQVTDSLGQTATAAQSIVVLTPLSIVTKMLTFEVGIVLSSPKEIVIAAPPGLVPSCSVIAGAPPPGFAVGSLAGFGCFVRGTPVSSGLYLVTVQARAGNALIGLATTSDVSFNVVPYISINTTSLPNGTIGSPYSQALTTFGGSAPFSWQVINGNLPAGLALNASTGVISGSPSAVGPQTFTVSVTDSLQATTQATLTLTVPSMTTGNVQFGVQQLLQIPADPGQSIADLKTDSRGSLIVAALVPVSSFVSNGTIKKIDTAGNQVFSVALPSIFAPTLTVDANDDIEVNGFTTAPSSFPATNVITPPMSGVSSQFVMKIRGLDGTVAYSTLVAPIRQAPVDPATVAAVDGAGHLFVAAQGPVTDLRSTSGAYSEGNNGSGSSLPPIKTQVSRIAAVGNQIEFSLIYGGGQIPCGGSMSGCMNSFAETLASRIMLDAQGNIWIAGTTNAPDLAISSTAIKTVCGCAMGPPYGLDAHDGFLAEFSPDGSSLLYGTFIGAVNNSVGLTADDQITAAVLDGSGHIWMVGTTDGVDFPVTADAVQSKLGGGVDAFIAEYDPATNKLLFATYFGGARNDAISKIELAPDGSLVFTGTSLSPALPISPAGFQRGSEFVGRIDSATHAITLTGLLAGSTGSGIAFMQDESPVVGGPSNVATVLQTNASSAPAIYGVVNSAGVAVTGQVAGEELISLYGVNIGPPIPVAADLSSGQTPTQLAGVKVLVDGVPVPLLYAQGDQINAIVPVAAASQSLIDVQVSSEGTVSTHATLGIVPAEPEVFQWGDATGSVALNEDGSLNSMSNPAKPLSMVTVFATGLGPLNPLPPDGQVLTGTLPALTFPVQVSGIGLSIQATAIPITGAVAGVFQLTFQTSALSGGGLRNFFQLAVGGQTSAQFGVWMR